MEFISKTMRAYIVEDLQKTLNLSTTVSLIALFIAILIYYLIKDNGLPPGPIGLPILGYWPFLRSEICHQQLLDLKKKYGSVFSYRVAGKLFINLADIKALREAHITKSNYFKERTSDYKVVGQIFEDSVLFAKGEMWKNVRNFFLQQFRERGMTLFKENTAEAMCETITVLIDELKKNTGNPLDIMDILVNKSIRIMHQTLFGMEGPVTEDDLKELLKSYKDAMAAVHSTNLILIGNVARFLIMPFLPHHKKAMRRYEALKSTLFRIVNEHKKSFDGDHVRNIIDSFIKERNTRKLKGDPTAEYFTDEVLVGSLIQFIGDGTVNVGAFVTFFLKSLLDHPEEQEKIYKELMEICGEDRDPNVHDKSKLTYTNAFLSETQRTMNFVPMFPNLECTEETTVGGYKIPKGAITTVNTFSIHNDPDVYEEPEKFDPTRFLSKEGKPKSESPVTFGVGKRVCLGESFVMMQVFLFCTTIIKNFRISYYRPKTHFEMFMSRELEICVTSRR